MISHISHLIGAMSGTSADGVDVALVRIEPHNGKSEVCLVHHLHLPYTASLQSRIFELRAGKPLYMKELLEVEWEITQSYGLAVVQLLEITQFKASDVAAIAAHGQTLFHEPPLTLQIFNPSLLAKQTQCPVVSNFRPADCAQGGQGAPLVPFADQSYAKFFRSKNVG